MIKRHINKILLLWYFIVLTTNVVRSSDIDQREFLVSLPDSFHRYVNLAYEYPDSALKLLEKSVNPQVRENNPKIQVRYLLALCGVKVARLEYNEAYHISKEALKLTKQLNDSILLMDAYKKVGELNFAFQLKVESLYHLSQALQITKQLYAEGKTDIQKLITSYFDMLISNKRFGQNEEARVYLDSCYMIADTSELSLLNMAYLSTERAYFLMLDEQIEQALGYLNSAKEVFESISSEDYREHSAYLANIYSSLGEAYRLNKSVGLSAQYFEKALSELEKNPRHSNHRPYILERFAWVLYEMGDYERASVYLQESIKVSELYFNAKSFTKEDFHILSTRYRSMLTQKMQEAMINNLELTRKEKAIARFRIFTVAVVLIFVFGVLYYRMKKQQYKHRLEKAEIQVREEQAIREVKMKNRELTTSTLKLIEKDQIISRVTDELKKYNSDSSKAVISSIQKSSDSMWEDFNKRFMAVNQDFYKKLTTQLPELSSNDLKLCALIKLNFSTKEMAQLLGISNESVQKARHRLRKKLRLGRDVNLTSFISAF